MSLGGTGHNVGERALADTWRAVENHRRERVALNCRSQDRVVADDMALPEELIQRGRAHASGKRSVR
jgi:hypothetical protein